MADECPICAATQRAKELDNELNIFFRKLVESQQPLGEEFSKVLHENAWELYER